ncbi:MAG TPA: pilus assembly protein PilM [Verrucomicrobiae bacterium]|nr:pilus assembly protein PilM [Verrucomicrobiae bacterium]
MLFRRNKQPKRELALGIDLGSSQIKAVVVRPQREKMELVECATRTLPHELARSHKEPEFSAEIQQLVEGLKTSERHAFVTISCGSAMVCQTEFPPVPLAEIKSALKLNSSGYLRRDFSSYYLDVFELQRGNEAAKGKEAAKTKVLVGGAQKEEVDALRDALVAAKVKPVVIELAAVSVINAFQVGNPGLQDEVVVLVDIGARMTSINFLMDGMPLITRIMHFGGAQLSDYISQILLLQPHEAEEEKRKMSEPVQKLVRTAISPLAREIRSSIDFFERQNERHVRQIFACGGSASSPALLTVLGESVGAQIECWNPVQNLDVSRLNGEKEQVFALGPTLAAAIGVAAARLS